MKMKKAIVSFPSKIGDNKEILESIEVERKIIQSKEQFEDYKKDFPTHYPLTEPHFKRELREGNIIIINGNGGWCVEGEGIKIIKYL